MKCQKKSIRQIGLDQEIMNMLKRHKANQAQKRLKFCKQITDYHDGGFVFC